jgi:hypothetical protein
MVYRRIAQGPVETAWLALAFYLQNPAKVDA